MPHSPITEEEARHIVHARITDFKESGVLKTMKDFAREMHECGVTRKLYGPRTLDDILKGRTFPKLQDIEGHPFDWTQVPKRSPGRHGTPGAATSTAGRLARLERQVRAIQARFDLPED